MDRNSANSYKDEWPRVILIHLDYCRVVVNEGADGAIFHDKVKTAL